MAMSLNSGMKPISHHRFDVYFVFQQVNLTLIEIILNSDKLTADLILAVSASALTCVKHVCVFYCMHIYICIQGSKVVQKASSKYWLTGVRRM